MLHPRRLRAHAPLVALLATSAPFAVFHQDWLADLSNPFWSGFLFTWLFTIVLWGSKGLVGHAEGLAAYTGEPLGTLILTLAVTGIEVLTIAIVVYTGADNPTLARDTMLSVTMIVLNGLVGLALLLGGLKHREQEYNLRGVNAFLSLILALAVFILLMPNFTISSDGPTFSYIQEVFLIVMCLGLYAVFLGIQTGRHRGYFSQPGSDHHSSSSHKHKHDRSALTSAALMLAHLVPVVFLVEQLAVVLNYGLDEMHAPAALGGLIVAILVLFPEGLAAVRAAVANHMQRSVNILLGSVLATLALTAPAVVILSLVRGAPVVLGVQGPNQPLLALTLALAVVTFSSGKTNVLQGVVHLMLFLAYLMLLFWG